MLMEHDQYEISFSPITGQNNTDSTESDKKDVDKENAFASINKLTRTKLKREKVLTAEDEKEELPVSVSYESEDKNCTFL